MSLEETKQKLDTANDTAKYMSIAKRIQDHLNHLKYNINKEKSRWFWELCQNAVDTISDENRKVSIALNFNEDKLCFQHNGNDFLEDDVPKFIFPAGLKNSTEKKFNYGRFGSGFLSTHIISAKINIFGKIANSNTCFKIEINRTKFEQITNLIENIKESEYVTLSKDSELFENNEYSTKFEYILDEKFYISPNLGTEFIEKTIAEIEKIIPYVFSFVNEIEKIKINDDIYTYESNILEEPYDRIKIIEVSKTKNDTKKIISKILTITDQDAKIFIAVPVNDLEMLEIDNDIPKLFFGFPLLNTENFPIPVILNCLNFNPKPERNGIELNFSDNESEESKQNKEIFTTNFIELYDLLLKFLSENEYGAIYNICKNKYQIDNNDIKKWYEEQLKEKITGKISEYEIIENHNSNYCKITDIYFPDAKTENEREKLWEFSEPIANEKAWNLPQKDEIENWYKILWKNLNKQTFDNLANDITGIEINVLNISWLNDVINFYIENNQQDILNTYAIIPNQKYELKKLNELQKDEIKIELKKILIILDNELTTKLLNKNIDININSFTTKKTEKKIFEILEEKIEPFETFLDIEVTEQNKILAVIFRLLALNFNENNEIDAEDNFRDEQNDIFKLTRNICNFYFEQTNIEYQNQAIDLWKKINKFILEYLAYKIDQLPENNEENRNSIEVLSEYFNNDIQKTLEWLNQFLKLVNTYYKSIIEKYKIFPNQSFSFKRKDDLFKDDKIPQKLKEAIILFPENNNIQMSINWKNNLLLNENLDAVQSLFNNNQSKNIKDIARDIDDNIITFYNIRNENNENEEIENNFIKLVNLLINFEAGTNDFQILFPNFTNKKPEMFLALFKDEKTRNNFSTILQEKEKLPLLAEISNIEKESLEELSKNHELLDRGIKTRKFTDEKFEQIISNREDINDFLDKKEKDKERIQKNKNFGKQVEELFNEVLEDKIDQLNLNIEISNEQRGQDFILFEEQSEEISIDITKKATENNKFYIEIKSIDNEKNRVLLSKRQAETAIKEDNYCLCVIIRNDNIDEGCIRNGYYIFDISTKIRNYIENEPNVGIEINKDRLTKYKIKQDLWHDDKYKGIDKLIEQITNYFNN